MVKEQGAVRAADVPLDRDVFMRTLIRELSGTRQDVAALDEAAGFVSLVGQNRGRQIDQDYRTAPGVERLDGYAKVALQQTMAEGAPGCRVVVHLEPSAEAAAAHGREYFGDAPRV